MAKDINKVIKGDYTGSSVTSAGLRNDESVALYLGANKFIYINKVNVKYCNLVAVELKPGVKNSSVGSASENDYLFIVELHLASGKHSLLKVDKNTLDLIKSKIFVLKYALGEGKTGYNFNEHKMSDEDIALKAVNDRNRKSLISFAVIMLILMVVGVIVLCVLVNNGVIPS